LVLEAKVSLPKIFKESTLAAMVVMVARAAQAVAAGQA